MKSLNYILYTLFLCIALACNPQKDKVKFVPMEETEYTKEFTYKIPIHHKIYEGMKHIDPKYIDSFIKTEKNNSIKIVFINQEAFKPFLTMQINEIVKDNLIDYLIYKYLHYYVESGELCHIEYPLDSSGRSKRIIYYSSWRPDLYTFYSYYIDWSNKPIADRSWMNNEDDDTDYSLYTWSINRSTDTIKTNFSQKTINKLYPDFEGVYIYKKYKEITIDHSFSSFDRSLFEHIEFVE
jgi:hypothetical protein